MVPIFWATLYSEDYWKLVSICNAEVTIKNFVTYLLDLFGFKRCHMAASFDYFKNQLIDANNRL